MSEGARRTAAALAVGLLLALPAAGASTTPKPAKKAPCDLVVVGTPIDLTRILKISKPSVRVTYELKERDFSLRDLVQKVGAIKK